MLEIGERDGGLGGHRNPQRVQGVLEAHQAQSDRTVSQVRTPRAREWCRIDVDDVVEHPHRRGDGALQPDVVQPAILDVVQKIDGAQVANRDLVIRGVERDFRAQIGGMDNAGVLLAGNAGCRGP